MNKKKPTIGDVAKLAGVSSATVSMVLSGKGRISPWTTQKIHRAIAEIGYIPSHQAATLRSGKTGLIGLIINNLNESFNHELLNGINRRLDESNNVAFILLYTTPEEREKRVNIALYHNVDALIIVSELPVPDALQRKIAQSPIAAHYITTSCQLNKPGYSGPDVTAGVKRAASYLIARGHRHIAFIGGEVCSYSRAEKLAGYFAALKDHHIMVNNDYIVPCGKRQQEAAAKTTDLMLQHPHLSALLCHDEHVTKGAMYAVKMAGRAVGKEIYVARDMALICLEKIDEGELMSPTITCLDSDASAIGYNAAHQVMSDHDDPGNSDHARQIIPQLLLRESA
jgi:LacI family transcriptional regulator of maltose regulon